MTKELGRVYKGWWLQGLSCSVEKLHRRDVQFMTSSAFLACPIKLSAKWLESKWIMQLLLTVWRVPSAKDVFRLTSKWGTWLWNSCCEPYQLGILFPCERIQGNSHIGKAFQQPIQFKLWKTWTQQLFISWKKLCHLRKKVILSLRKSHVIFVYQTKLNLLHPFWSCEDNFILEQNQ